MLLEVLEKKELRLEKGVTLMSDIYSMENSFIPQDIWFLKVTLA